MSDYFDVDPAGTAQLICQCCGHDVDDCICPECDVCDCTGNPECYSTEGHGQLFTHGQLEGKQRRLELDAGDAAAGKAQFEDWLRSLSP